MSSEYEDKEREFLSYLKADTGRDLAEWMVAITDANLAHRNEVIDWLRQQGFIFAWASWLERIHHTGGRPIYLSEVPPSLDKHQRAPSIERPSKPVSPPPPEPEVRVPPAPSRPVLVYTAPTPASPRASEAPPVAPGPPAPYARPPAAEPAEEPAEPAKSKPPSEAAEPAKSKPHQTSTLPPTPSVKPQPPPVAATAGSTGLTPEVTALVAKAKAYAPLAGFILRSLNDALPETALVATGKYIAFNRPETFAILVPGPKDIKLGVALDAAPFEREIVTARFANLLPAPPKAITHMVVLTDARQIDGTLMDLLRSANGSVNG